MEHIYVGVVLSALGSPFIHYTFAPSVCARSGILIAWKHDLGPAGATRVDNFSASVQFQPAGRGA